MGDSNSEATPWDLLSDEQRERLKAATAESLGDDVLVCGRVWTAWSYGTMAEDDFWPARSDDDVVSAVAASLCNAMRKMEVSR